MNNDGITPPDKEPDKEKGPVETSPTGKEAAETPAIENNERAFPQEDTALDLSEGNIQKEITPRGGDEETQENPEKKALKAALSKIGLGSKAQEKLNKALEAEGGSVAAQEEGNLIKQKKAAEKKKKRKYTMYGGGALFLIFIIYLLFKPFTGGITFGICKTFLELQVRYPEKIHLSTVEDFGNSVRIWYTSLDSFGEYKLEPIQCYFENDPQTGLKMIKVTMSRRELPGETVEAFNAAIPGLIANPPDLTLPVPLSDSLRDLHIDADAFRMPIFR